MILTAYDELCALIDYIQAIYTEVTNEWMKSPIHKHNLKQIKVSDVIYDETIIQGVHAYLQLLNERSADIILPLSSVCSYKVTARVKAQNSVTAKIQNYQTVRHEFGKVPLNKCLNDLFGVRVVVPDFLSFSQISDFLKETYPGKYKCIDSSKLEYTAIHLYFKAKENNQAFQWELQIWNLCNETNNLASHKKYKQAYVSWEKESKEGGIVNG